MTGPAGACGGPDEPAPGMTAAQEEDAHWEHLAALAQAAGVTIRAGALRALPLETEASAALEALAARSRDRAVLRAANELGLRRVGRELRFLVR